MNRVNQATILGESLQRNQEGYIKRNSFGTENPDTLTIYELTRQPDTLPGIDFFTGRTQRVLSAVLTVATGRIETTTLIQRIMAQDIGGFDIEHNIVSAALKDPAIFEVSPNRLGLRTDRSVCHTDFAAVRPEMNVNLLGAATCYINTMNGLSNEDFQLWTRITGIKNTDPLTATDTIGWLKLIGTEPDGEYTIDTDGIGSETSRRNFNAVRKMVEAGMLTQFTPDGRVVKCFNRELNGCRVRVPGEAKEKIAMLAGKIAEYDERLERTLEDGVDDVFTPVLPKNNHEGAWENFGINRVREDVLAGGYRLYNAIRHLNKIPNNN